MSKYQIQGASRNKFGKAVKSIKSAGLVPASVYGPAMDSVSLEVETKLFNELFSKAGFTGLVDLELDGKAHQVLIKEVQRHPITQAVRHVSFYKVDPERVISNEVPLKLVGESPAVRRNIGFLTMPLDHITVRCKPANLPEYLEIDITKLDQVGSGVSVGDLVLPEGVSLHQHMHKEATIVKIQAPQKQLETTTTGETAASAAATPAAQK